MSGVGVVDLEGVGLLVARLEDLVILLCKYVHSFRLVGLGVAPSMLPKRLNDVPTISI